MVETIAILVGTACTGKLIPLIGKKRLYVISLFFAGVLPAIRIFAPANIIFIMIVTAIMGFGGGLQSPLSYGIQADNTDFIELDLGYRAEGAVASLSSLMAKVGMGIAGSVPGYVLAIVGFDASLTVQPEAVTNALIYLISFFPLILDGLAMLIMGVFYPLTKEKLEEQNAKIAELRVKDNRK